MPARPQGVSSVSTRDSRNCPCLCLFVCVPSSCLMIRSAAHYVIDDINGLPRIIDDINRRLAAGESP